MPVSRLETPTDLLVAVTRMYLDSIGWTALEAGPIEIDPRADGLNHRLVVRFVGGPKQTRPRTSDGDL